MEPSIQFVITLGVGILLFGAQVIVGLIAYATRQTQEAIRSDFAATKAEVARQRECLTHLEHTQDQDAHNLEEWKLKYAEAHGPLVSRVAAIEGAVNTRVDAMGLDVRTLLIQLPLLTQTITNLDKRLAELERSLKESGRGGIH